MTNRLPLFVPCEGNVGGKDLLIIEKNNHRAALANSRSVMRIFEPIPHVDVWKKRFLKTQPLDQPKYFIDGLRAKQSYKEIPKGVDISRPKTFGLRLKKKNNLYASDDHRRNILSLTKHLTEIDLTSRRHKLELKAERQGLSAKGKPSKWKKRVWRFPFPDGYESHTHHSKPRPKSSKRRSTERASSSAQLPFASTLRKKELSTESSKVKAALYTFITANLPMSPSELIALESETLLQFPNLDKGLIHKFFDEMLVLIGEGKGNK